MKRTDTKIAGVRVTVTALAAAIHAQGAYLKRAFAKADLQDDPTDPDAFAGTDARLQVHGGSWQLHTDRGAWGSSSIPWGCTWKEAREIARELISECGDCAAEMTEEEGSR